MKTWRTAKSYVWQQMFEDWEKGAFSVLWFEKEQKVCVCRTSMISDKKMKLAKCGCQGNNSPNLHMNSPWKRKRDHFYKSVFCHLLWGLLPSLWHLEDDDASADVYIQPTLNWWICRNGKCSFTESHLRACSTQWWNKKPFCFWNKEIKWKGASAWWRYLEKLRCFVISVLCG